MHYLAAISFILSIFFLGFWTGRRLGKKEGIDEGILFAPLELRRQGLEDGWCHICGSRVLKDKKLTRPLREDRI